MEFTQVLLSESIEEVNSTNEKLPVATLKIEDVQYTIYNSENTIGRDDSCDITINNNVVSSKHAVIEAEDPNAHLLYDLGSTNKTKLGKVTLKPHVRYNIKDGDIVTFGNISALYSVSRQTPSTPEKDSLLSILETPEKDGTPQKNVVSDSSPEDDKNYRSIADTSDIDLFDENECDTSAIQQEVVGSTIEQKDSSKNNIYEMDTLNFDSDVFQTDDDRLKEYVVNSDHCNSAKTDLVHDMGNGETRISDSQNAESIYDICTQRSKISDDELEVCDSTMKGMDIDKQNMEVTSSVSEEKENKESNAHDVSIYEIQTQETVIDENEFNKNDPLYEKGETKNNKQEWEDFPDIASPVGLDTSNADNLVCPDPNKSDENNETSDISAKVKKYLLEEKVEDSIMEDSKQDPSSSYNFYKVAHGADVEHNAHSVEIDRAGVDEESNKKSSSKLKIDESLVNVQQDNTFVEDIFLPASQNIDMFETSLNKRDSFEKNQTCNSSIRNFNESDDEAINNLANELFPIKSGLLDKSGQDIDKEISNSFLFEAATQPAALEGEVINNCSISRVDETLSTSFFEAATQPAVSNILPGVNNFAPQLNGDASSSTNLDTLKELKEASEAFLESEKMPSEESFFLAETQPVTDVVNKHGRIESVKTDSSSCNISKETSKTLPENVQHSLINEERTLSENFFESATQPFVSNSKSDVTQEKTTKNKEKICDHNETSVGISNEMFDFDESSKQFSEDIIMTQGFYDAATQPSVGSSPISVKTKPPPAGNISEDGKSLKFFPAYKNEVTILNKDELNTSLSDSFHEMATQPIPNIENDISPQKGVLVNNRNIDSITKEGATFDVLRTSVDNEDNNVSDSFYELATQPVLSEDIDKQKISSNNTNINCTKNVRDLSEVTPEPFLNQEFDQQSISLIDIKQEIKSCAKGDVIDIEINKNPVANPSTNILEVYELPSQQPLGDESTKGELFLDLNSSCNLESSKLSGKPHQKENDPITPLVSRSAVPDSELGILDNNFYEAATQPFPSDNVNQVSNQTETANKIPVDSTVCKEVLMELSESICPSTTQWLNKAGKVVLSKEADFNRSVAAEETRINNTIQDNVDMSISSVNFKDVLTQEVPRSDHHVPSNKYLKIKKDNINNVGIPNAVSNLENTVVNSTTQELLKVLQGDDDDNMSEHKVSVSNEFVDIVAKEANPMDTEPSKQSLDLQTLSEGTKQVVIEDVKGGTENSSINVSTNDSCKEEKKEETFDLRDSGPIVPGKSSQEDSPVVVTHRKDKRLIINDESEQSSEEFIVKFKKKGCNIFPPDSQDFISPEKEGPLTTDAKQIEKSKKQQKKDKIIKSKPYQKSDNESCSYDGQESSEEPIMKFKRKNVNIFPPDSEPIISNCDKENDGSIQSSGSTLLKSEINEEPPKSCSPLSKENTEKESSKKTKSSTDREQVFVSRGNITLHSQEVLEELEEQFRLTAVAMSPTQLSVVSDSSDEAPTNEHESPVIRRSERKKSENVLYKPLVSKKSIVNMNTEQKKMSSTSTSKVQKRNSGQANSKLPSKDNVDKNIAPPEDEKQLLTDEQNSRKSVKKFKKVTPTKDHLLNRNKKSSDDNINDILENIKKESFDSTDSQSSMSNLENSENGELGRGKRKRVRTSFDDFVLDDDFKKLRKKSSSPIVTQDSQLVKSEKQDIKVETKSRYDSQEFSSQTQKLRVVLHDINKNSTSSTSVLKVESKTENSATSENTTNTLIDNYEDDLILPPTKANVSKTKIISNKNETVTSKSEEKNKTLNESCSKANTMSFCEKLDELFNIWGPADRVKLSPRVPKKTFKVLQNEATMKSKESPVSGKGKTRKSSDISPETTKSDTLRKSNTSNSQESSNSKPSSSRRLFLKHKMNEESSNKPVEKKQKKSRINSQSDSVHSSDCSENSDFSVGTRRSTRKTASTPPKVVESITKKRSLHDEAKTKSKNGDDQTLSPDTNIKKRRGIESKNNSQEMVTKKSQKPSHQPENTSNNNVCDSKAANSTKGNKKKTNQPVSTRNNLNIRGKCSTTSLQDDDNYIMSQEFSFHARSERKKTPMKEEFKPPQLTVRRSARSKNYDNKNDRKDSQKVLFTGLTDRKLSALVTKLGGEVVDSPFTCTVLITDKVRRTAKFLSALSRGIPIVTPQWLTNSTGGFADVDRFIVNDEEAEKSYSFSLKNSINKAKERKLLEGWSVYVTSSVNPPTEDMKSIIECSGGRCLVKEPARWPPNSLVISCEEDKGKWNSLTKRGKRPPIVGTEALFSGILQQNLKIEDYRLL